MKQRINVEDLAQLTPKQQEKLRAWWEPNEYDVFYTSWVEGVVESVSLNRNEEEYISSIDDFGGYKENCLPLLSIGQLIELLIQLQPYKDWECQFILEESLCDDLWDLAKEIL